MISRLIVKLRNNKKPILFLLLSTVVAGLLFTFGLINVQFIVVVGLAGFVLITLLILLANFILRKNSKKINEIYQQTRSK